MSTRLMQSDSYVSETSIFETYLNLAYSQMERIQLMSNEDSTSINKVIAIIILLEHAYIYTSSRRYYHDNSSLEMLKEEYRNAIQEIKLKDINEEDLEYELQKVDSIYQNRQRELADHEYDKAKKNDERNENVMHSTTRILNSWLPYFEKSVERQSNSLAAMSFALSFVYYVVNKYNLGEIDDKNLFTQTIDLLEMLNVYEGGDIIKFYEQSSNGKSLLDEINFYMMEDVRLLGRYLSSSFNFLEEEAKIRKRFNPRNTTAIEEVDTVVLEVSTILESPDNTFDASSVGYFLWTFSSAVKSIGDIKVEIQGIERGSLIINLKLRIKNTFSKVDLFDLLHKAFLLVESYYHKKPFSELHKFDAEAAKLNAEAEKLNAEKSKIAAETVKIQAETDRLNNSNTADKEHVNQLNALELRKKELENELLMQNIELVKVQQIQAASDLIKNGLVQLDTPFTLFINQFKILSFTQANLKDSFVYDQDSFKKVQSSEG